MAYNIDSLLDYFGKKLGIEKVQPSAYLPQRRQDLGSLQPIPSVHRGQEAVQPIANFPPVADLRGAGYDDASIATIADLMVNPPAPPGSMSDVTESEWNDYMRSPEAQHGMRLNAARESAPFLAPASGDAEPELVARPRRNAVRQAMANSPAAFLKGIVGKL